MVLKGPADLPTCMNQAAKVRCLVCSFGIVLIIVGGIMKCDEAVDFAVNSIFVTDSLARHGHMPVI